jgi:hypothetical protein
MAASQQIWTLAVVPEGGTFQVSGVFWLVPPANAVVPILNFRSLVHGLAASDLDLLRLGAIVEQPFTSTTVFASGATQATVDAALQTQYTTAQTALTNSTSTAPATAVPRAFNGSTWGASPQSVSGLPISPLLYMPCDTSLQLAASMGLLPGITTSRAAGYVAAATVAQRKIRSTTYTPTLPGVAGQRSFSSSSANDTNAGTGARTILHTYLTTAFVRKTQVVALNGVTAVNGAAVDCAYDESIVVLSSGSLATPWNVGVVSMFLNAGGAGGTVMSIAATDNQTYYAHHYVAAGETCFLTNVMFGDTLTGGVGFISRSGDPSQTTLPLLGIGGLYPHASGDAKDHTFSNALGIPGPDYICLNDTPNAAVAGNFSYGSFEYFTR